MAAVASTSVVAAGVSLFMGVMIHMVSGSYCNFPAGKKQPGHLRHRKHLDIIQCRLLPAHSLRRRRYRRRRHREHQLPNNKNPPRAHVPAVCTYNLEDTISSVPTPRLNGSAGWAMEMTLPPQVIKIFMPAFFHLIKGVPAPIYIPVPPEL